MTVTVYLKSGNTMCAEFEEGDGDLNLLDALLDPGVGIILVQDDSSEFMVPKENIDYIKVHNVQ